MRVDEAMERIQNAAKVYVVVELSPGIKSNVECKAVDLVDELRATYHLFEEIRVKGSNEPEGEHLFLGDI